MVGLHGGKKIQFDVLPNFERVWITLVCMKAKNIYIMLGVGFYVFERSLLLLSYYSYSTKKQYIYMCVCVCVYVVYEDTNLYNDMGMT